MKMNFEKYNESQIELILNAKERGLPIEKYIRPTFSTWTIRYLIVILTENHNLDDFPFDEYNDEQIKTLLYAIYLKKNWKNWASPEMSYRVMNLFILSKNSQDLLYFYKRGFKLIELNQIDKFINDGFDPKVVDNLKFNVQPMREIRKALRSEISVTKLANPNLTWKEIRTRRIKAYGIKKGIEFYITHYNKL